MFKIDLRETL